MRLDLPCCLEPVRRRELDLDWMAEVAASDDGAISSGGGTGGADVRCRFWVGCCSSSLSYSSSSSLEDAVPLASDSSSSAAMVAMSK